MTRVSGVLCCSRWPLSLVVLILCFPRCHSFSPLIGQMGGGFRGSQLSWIDNGGVCLYSPKRTFALGLFNPAKDGAFYLSVRHVQSSVIVWTANRDFPVSNSDIFQFLKNGSASLTSAGGVVWSTKTDSRGAQDMALWESGNLVLLDGILRVLWQSFDYPTDTLLANQSFEVGMKLVSSLGAQNLSAGKFLLEMQPGDLVLRADYRPPQIYWTMQNDVRTVRLRDGSPVTGLLTDRYWGLYDEQQNLLSQLLFSTPPDLGGIRTAVLGTDGTITFNFITSGGTTITDEHSIPGELCQVPSPCGSYSICHDNKQCECPAVFSPPMPGSACGPGPPAPCGAFNNSASMIKIRDDLSYFAIDFTSPVKRSGLEACQQACLKNCTCNVLLFSNKSGDCYTFNQIGSLQLAPDRVSGYAGYFKASAMAPASPGLVQPAESGKQVPYVAIIVVATVLVILAIVASGWWYFRKKAAARASACSSDEDKFLDNIPGLPARFSYRELQIATENFSRRLGKGGFGSVYEGILPDGSKVAVKQLEGIGQGKKEFHAEVATIGSIHHVNLVRLRGFCADGLHRLLVYEYMASGSLDRYLFRNKNPEVVLNWGKRYSIALGTAKGLAYLHGDCNVRIIHCDIKPENILLDEDYEAKVSDFGLAKLMTKEQSHVFTTLRGTRGYLAPEWLTTYAISDKSDVYSFGMVLLELIGGRKNFDPEESSEKSYFPAYAFKQVEEGKIGEILDSKLEYDAEDESVSRAVRVALWCIQEDFALRPSMGRVVQMLEGLINVPRPPSSHQAGFRIHQNILKSSSEEGISSDPSLASSQDMLSAVRLSGPR